ncbi:EamA-like transporter family protein [Corynebacterium pseudotuberculosis]|uniref:DMT family transporter n=1 Tax=Corynebacterium pseudotuberculosis TaxID=1719 RepID=UPI000CDCA1EA|nr:DMT family transporter [Corynebacterium pseudotuberculosis]AUY61053.1 EamA-like transporter family protein [Corynebacterium pseudotuberculosis]
MLWLLLGIAAGAVIPVQTLVNTPTQRIHGTPFSSSMISFCVGTLTLAAALIAATGQLPSLSAAYDAPAWIWIGGFLGVIALTANIFMFPRLGAVETVVLPISGQIFMGLVIDHWGLFDAQQNPITVLRVVGALLVFAGVVATVGKPQRSADQSVSLIHWLWRLAGISFGMLTAMQSAINGRLGSVLNSAATAALVSFAVGATNLIALNIVLRWRPRVPRPGSSHPWWMWFGGSLGALFIFANAALVPKIGTGLTVVAALLGMMISSIAIERIRGGKTEVRQILGVTAMLAGIIVIRLL